MPEKDEFDRYAVPKSSRFKIFQWGLGGMSATASVLLVMLLNCKNSERNTTERLLNKQIEMMVAQQAKQESVKQVQQANNEISPKIDSVSKQVDSLNNVVNALQK